MKKFAAVLLLLRALPCVAQQGITSELTGRVTSAGQPLPGVTVTLTAESLQGSRVAITGQNGGFLFALLPPADYALRCELQGFSAAEKRVRVALAETARVDIEMGAAPLRESMTVESDRDRVAEGASISTNFRAAHLQNLPGPRDIRAAVLLSPSAERVRDRLVISGAPTWDSLFLVDGVVVNENMSGQPHNLFIEDAIQEIAVLTGGIATEYGRFTGGVVTTLTKSGGNEFRGSLRDTVRNAAWTQRTPWPGEPHPLDRLNHGIEGTLGGFLAKDRLWFFAAARKAQESVGRFTLTHIAYGVDSHDTRVEGKLTGQITPRHSLVATYVRTTLTETNVFDSSVARVLDLASLIPKRSQPTHLLALTYQGVFGLNTFSELHYSRKTYALRGNGGRSTDRVLGTPINVHGDKANLNAPFGCGICGDDDRDSNSWAAKTSHYENSRWGNHTAVVGAEGFHEQRINSGNRSPSQFSIQNGSVQIVGASAYPLFDANTLIDWTPLIPGARRSDLNTWSAYLNDRWDVISRVSVNLGLRYDRNSAKDAIGRLISDDSAYSPRVSATLDVRNDGRHRAVASYGRYTSKILEGGGSPQQPGVFTLFGWRYGGPVINALGTAVDKLLTPSEALARVFAWFDSVGGVQNRQYLSLFIDPHYSSEFRRSLKSPAVDEWSLGYAIQLQSGYLRADYVARDWHHFYAARVDKTTGQQITPVKPVDIAWIINDDSGTVRTYRGVQFQGSWHRGGATLGGGYTWSRLRGNDEADELTANTAPRNLPLRLWYPEFLGYPQRRPTGYLGQDQRHRARLWVGYEVALHRGLLSAALLQWFDSGRAYSAVADINAIRFEGMPANPGYEFNQVTQGVYFFSKRGAFRTDNVFSTDLSVNWEIPYHRVRPYLKGDILNLFNNAAVVSPDTEVMTRFRNGATSGLVAFNPFTDVPIEGVHYRLSPTFGKPTGPESYQAARTFQLSFGARF